MQLNWSVHHTWLDWEQVQADYTYNIEKGAEILASSVVTVDVNQGDLSPTGAPIEQYLRLWAYNGYSDENNPGNENKYLPDRNWDENKRITCPKKDIDYPYQELILYAAKCNPTVEGLSWQAIGDFPLPDDALFADDLEKHWGPTRDILIFETAAQINCLGQPITFEYTLPTTKTVTTQITIKNDGPWNEEAQPLKTLSLNQNHWDGTDETGQPLPPGVYWFTVAVSNTNQQLIGLQSNPVQLACNHPLYLPLILKNYPLLYFFETFNPIQSGWEFYTNDPQNEAETYIYVLTSAGQDDNQSLFMTEQIGLRSFTAGGLIEIPIPNPPATLWLSFWVRRFGDYGAYQVLVDDQVVVSEVGTADTWHYYRVEVTFGATDGLLHLQLQVPSQFLGHAVLFDTIRVFGE